MNVVFFVRRYWPAVGGVERHVAALIDALVELQPDLKITIVTELHDPKLERSELVHGVLVHRIPVGSSAKNLKKEIWSWLSEHEEILNAADIIHIHDVFFWILPQLLSLHRAKLFMTFHGYEPPGPPTRTQRFWHQLAELCTEGNICVGGFHQKWYRVTPTFTTFGATSLTSKQPRVRKKSGKHYLFVGRLEADTGIWSYLESMQRLSTENITLDVIGDGPLRGQLERFVQRSQLSVNFLGTQSVSAETYQRYDASLVSGYLSILESLAAGVPVISTYATQLKHDYLTDTPFFDWISVAAPGNELDAAMMSPKAQNFAAQEWASAQSWQLLAKQYLSLWKVNS